MSAKYSLKSLSLRQITTCYPTTPPSRTGTASEHVCVVTGVKNWSLSLATFQHIPFHFGITPEDDFYHSDEYFFSLFFSYSYDQLFLST